jgi:hypothetical protein
MKGGSHNFIDETGNVYGPWKVVARDDARKMRGNRGKTYWSSECTTCGYTYSIAGGDLRQRTPACKACAVKARENRVCKHCGSPDLAPRGDGRKRPVCNACHNKTRKKQKPKGNEPVDKEIAVKVEIGPIADWMRPYFAKYPIMELSQMCDTDDTTLRRIKRRDRGHLKMDTVDRILVTLGHPICLGRLYPELYEDPSVFA